MMFTLFLFCFVFIFAVAVVGSAYLFLVEGPDTKWLEDGASPLVADLLLRLCIVFLGCCAVLVLKIEGAKLR